MAAKKYRVYKDGNRISKAISFERANNLAARCAAKSPHRTFTVNNSAGEIISVPKS